MRKVAVLLVICLVFISGIQEDKSLFTKGKILLFDEKWEDALEIFNKLEKKYSNSQYLPMSYFYKGKCLEELKKREKAINSFEKFLVFSDNDSLSEEAEISIINNAFKLYEKGNTAFLKKITGRLSSFNKSIRYYAAFSLSYAKDKTVSKKALPVLKKILFDEEDVELLERAKLAILRISPKELEKIQNAKLKTGKSARMLRIRIIDKTDNKAKVTINIPFSLAELAIKSLPDNEKEALIENGYDLDTIIKTLVNAGEIIKIDDEDELIKIWVE
jgi:tetratricopeptide (TPR) repeat protein